MKRFQPFVGSVVERARLDDPVLFDDTGIAPRYLPDVFEEFDEMEFLAPFEGDRKLVFSLALEQGKVMRILIGWVEPDDPDDFMRSFDEEGLRKALDLQGEALVRFMERTVGRAE